MKLLPVQHCQNGTNSSTQGVACDDELVVAALYSVLHIITTTNRSLKKVFLTNIAQQNFLHYYMYLPLEMKMHLSTLCLFHSLFSLAALYIPYERIYVQYYYHRVQSSQPWLFLIKYLVLSDCFVNIYTLDMNQPNIFVTLVNKISIPYYKLGYHGKVSYTYDAH